MGEDTVATEQRNIRRQRVLKNGKIVFRNNMSVVDCVVRDMSATGARIACYDPAAVPSEFRLVLPADNTIRDVKVVWRRGALIGLRFTSEAKRAPPRKW